MHSKIVQCASCGDGLAVSKAARKARHCPACRIRRYQENLASLMLKSGEPYERMLRAQRAAREREIPGGGPTG